MYFDNEYNKEIMMENIVRKSFRRCLPGLHVNPALDFVLHENFHATGCKHPLTGRVT